MIIDITEMSDLEIKDALGRINHEMLHSGLLPWALEKNNDDPSTPEVMVVYSGELDRTFEVGLRNGDRPVVLSYKTMGDQWKSFLMFPPAPTTTITVTSTYIKLELRYKGKASGDFLLKCPT